MESEEDSILGLKVSEQYARSPELWQDQGTPQSNCHKYIIITTPQSYKAHLHQVISYKYRWSAQPDPPPFGPGSKTPVRFTEAYISGLLPLWVVINKFHLLKSLSRNAGL